MVDELLKTCPICKRQFTREWLRGHTDEFLRDSSGHIVGETGLALFNCSCGTTLGVEPATVWPCLRVELAEYYAAAQRMRIAYMLLLTRLERAQCGPKACDGQGPIAGKCGKCPCRAQCPHGPGPEN